MDLYECTVNLFSKNQNQVSKTDVTAAEIMLLRALHGASHEGVGGNEPVTSIKKIGEVQRTDAEERERLTGTESRKEGLGVPFYKEEVFRKVFPNDYVPLPQFLPGFEPTAKPPAKLKKEAANAAAAAMNDEAFA
jgi:hypothetical protein